MSTGSEFYLPALPVNVELHCKIYSKYVFKKMEWMIQYVFCNRVKDTAKTGYFCRNCVSQIGNYCHFCGHFILRKWKTYHYCQCKIYNFVAICMFDAVFDFVFVFVCLFVCFFICVCILFSQTEEAHTLFLPSIHYIHSWSGLQFIKGSEAELAMSQNVILRKTCFKVSITAKKSEILIHNVIRCRYVPSPIWNYILQYHN